MKQVEKLKTRGVWVISKATPEKVKYRENRIVVFPYDLKVGEKMQMFYVGKQGENHDSVGKYCLTTKIKEIHKDKYGVEFKVTTQNSEYVFLKNI